MDSNPDPNARRFAHLDYDGAGIVIRADQRGASPKQGDIHGKSLRATIRYQDRTCSVEREALWEQSSGWFDLRFSSDEEFMAFVADACGWQDIELPEALPTEQWSCSEIGREPPAVATNEGGQTAPETLPVPEVRQSFATQLETFPRILRGELYTKVLETVGLLPNPLWREGSGLSIFVVRDSFEEKRKHYLRMKLRRRVAEERAFLDRYGGYRGAWEKISSMAEDMAREILAGQGLYPDDPTFEQHLAEMLPETTMNLADQILPLYTVAVERAAYAAGADGGPEFERAIEPKYEELQNEWSETAGALTKVDRLELDRYWNQLPPDEVMRGATMAWENLLSQDDRQRILTEMIRGRTAIASR